MRPGINPNFDNVILHSKSSKTNFGIVEVYVFIYLLKIVTVVEFVYLHKVEINLQENVDGDLVFALNF